MERPNWIALIFPVLMQSVNVLLNDPMIPPAYVVPVIDPLLLEELIVPPVPVIPPAVSPLTAPVFFILVMFTVLFV